jgi:hypothetical protein
MPRVELPRRLARCLARYAEAAGKSPDQAAERCLELALNEVIARQKQVSAAAGRCFESALDEMVMRQRQISVAAERRLDLALARRANERVRDCFVAAAMPWMLCIEVKGNQ